jgi:hypothetical protein
MPELLVGPFPSNKIQQKRGKKRGERGREREERGRGRGGGILRFSYLL